MDGVRIYQSLEELPAHYGRLFKAASASSGVFLSLPWFRNLVQTAFAENKQLRLYAIEPGTSESGALALLPMCYEQAARGRFAARHLSAAGNYYTSLFSPLVVNTDTGIRQYLQALAKAIAFDAPHWDTVDLHPLQKETPLFGQLQQAFREAGMAVQTYFCFGNWYLLVNGRSYEEYFNTLPSRLRNTVKRKARQLSDSGRLRLEIISDITDIERGIAAYEKVYRASWKKPEPHPAFMPGLIRTAAEQGWLRLGIACIDGEPAAAQVWFVSNHVASIFKLAYDERFSRLSVGSVLTAHLMQHVIDMDRVAEVDYLTGDDEYKQDWMSDRRERWGILAFNLRTVNGAFAAMRHIGGGKLKSFASRAMNTGPEQDRHLFRKALSRE